MSILHRYLLREIMVPFAVGLGLFFAVVSFAEVLKVADSVTGMGITTGEILQALWYSLPPLLGLLLPVTSLFATLLGVGRLASDRELLGFCASGVSPYRLLVLPGLLGMVSAAVAATAIAFGEPWGIAGLRSLMARSAQRAVAHGVRPGEFYEWIGGVTFFAGGRQGDELSDIVFTDRREALRPLVISARRGKVQQGQRPEDLVFALQDGVVLADTEAGASRRLIHFESSVYRLDVGRLVGNKARNLAGVQEKSVATLWRESHDLAASPAHRNLLTITLHRKAAVPLAAAIFALLAVPLACRPGGAARARGFLFSTFIVGTYYYIGRAAELSARNGFFNPVLAAWLPDLLGLVALTLLLRRFGDRRF